MLLTIIILLSLLSHRVWFFSNSILSHSDWGYHYTENLKAFLAFPSIWSSAGFGSVNLGVTSYPLELLWGIFGSVCTFSCAERLIYFWPSLLLSVLSSYVLVHKITLNKTAAVIGSLVFTYNTYFMIGRSVHVPLMVAFAIAPLAVYLLLTLYEKFSLKNAVQLAITNIVMSIYEFRAWYIVAGVQMIIIMYLSVTHKSRSLRANIAPAISSIFALIIVLVVNIYWIISLSMSNSLTGNKFFSRGLFGNSFVNITNSMTLFHPFWTGGKTSSFIVQSIPAYVWIIPLFAFLGLYVSRHKRIILLFGLISFVGIFLTKQSAIPFTHVYQYLYNNLPGFNAYRESSKFFFLIALGYSVLIAEFVRYLLENITNSSWLHKFRHSIIIIITCAFLINIVPVTTGEMNALFVPRRIPAEYLSYKGFIQNQDDFFRTLWIPRDSRWTFFDARHPSVGFTSMFSEDQTDLSDSILSDIHSGSKLDEILDIGSIKYIAVPLVDNINDDNFFTFYKSKDTYMKQLDKMTFLSKHSHSKKDSIVLYENNGYKDHIHTSHGNVRYEQIRPYMYKIHVRNVNAQTKIYLSESYHSGWSMIFKLPTIRELATSKNYMTSTPVNTYDVLYTNSFIVDPKYIKNNINHKLYSKNSDGSINFEAYITFLPQLYMHMAIGFTLIIVSLCLITIAVIHYISRRRESSQS